MDTLNFTPSISHPPAPFRSQGSFLMDMLGTFPINLVQMALNPDNPYADLT
jgi:hypothetical protein